MYDSLTSNYAAFFFFSSSDFSSAALSRSSISLSSRSSFSFSSESAWTCTTRSLIGVGIDLQSHVGEYGCLGLRINEWAMHEDWRKSKDMLGSKSSGMSILADDGALLSVAAVFRWVSLRESERWHTSRALVTRGLTSEGWRAEWMS